MVKVTVIGTLVVLVSVPEIKPEPLAGIPVTVATLSLVQLYTVPATALPLRMIGVIALAEHIVCEAGVAVAVKLHHRGSAGIGGRRGRIDCYSVADCR